MKNIKSNIEIGKTIYIVENWNCFYDTKIPRYCTIYTKDEYSYLKITEHVIEGYIVDEDGIHIAELSHDGWNKLTTYHNIQLEKYEGCKMFDTLDDAYHFIQLIAIDDWGE